QSGGQSSGRTGPGGEKGEGGGGGTSGGQGGGQGSPGGPLGQGASSGGVLMNGTVGQGDQNAGFGGGFPPGGGILQGPGGTGYNEYSDSVFNARPYSLTQPNAPKIPTWSEQIGGNLGGPLVIPHIYDGHDKTFFFVNFDSTWARNSVDQFSTVPTVAERSGNF